MKSLILFTVSYPYGSKEQFLETEILYLSEAFKEVIVIPMQMDGKMREVPQNIKVDTAFSVKNSNAKFLIYSFLSISLYKEIFKYPFVLFSLKRLSKLFAFVGKGVCLYKYLKDAYGAENIFYSYWFNGAVFGCFLYNKYVHPIKFYTRVHRNDLYIEENYGYLPLRPAVIAQIKKVFSISKHGSIYLKEQYNLNEDKVKVSRLGTKNMHVCTKMTVGSNIFSIVSCSYLNPVKRVDMLIKVLSIVADSNPMVNINWTHLGGGPEYSHIQDLIQQLAPTNLHIELFDDVTNENVMRYYKENNIDLFVNLSSSEGIPVTFMEAFSCSVPVLAIDTGGVSEIVNNQNGVLLKKDSSLEEIALSISKCVRDKETLYEKKSRARNMWEKSYNAEKNYINFCKELNKDD